MQAGNEETEDSRLRLVTQASCYKTPAAVPPQRNLLVSLDASSEALLVPIMGVLVPMHILTVKAIQYSQVRPRSPAHLPLAHAAVPTYLGQHARDRSAMWARLAGCITELSCSAMNLALGLLFRLQRRRVRALAGCKCDVHSPAFRVRVDLRRSVSVFKEGEHCCEAVMEVRM